MGRGKTCTHSVKIFRENGLELRFWIVLNVGKYTNWKYSVKINYGYLARNKLISRIFWVYYPYSVSSIVVQIFLKPFYFSIPKLQNRLPLNWLNQISSKNYLIHSIVSRMLNNFCLKFGSANLEPACSENLTENLHD